MISQSIVLAKFYNIIYLITMMNVDLLHCCCCRSLFVG